MDQQPETILFTLQNSPGLKASWQKQVLLSNGYLELGMLDDAAKALEEIESAEKSRKEVLSAQLDLYIAEKKWEMAAIVGGHLVKADPGNPATWINLAYLVRRAVNVEQAETVLFKARKWHPRNALIAFKLACCASALGRVEEAKVRLRHAVSLDKNIRRLALEDEDMAPFGIKSIACFYPHSGWTLNRFRLTPVALFTELGAERSSVAAKGRIDMAMDSNAGSQILLQIAEMATANGFSAGSSSYRRKVETSPDRPKSFP